MFVSASTTGTQYWELQTQDSPHTAVRQNPVGIHTQSHPTLCGIGLHSDTVCCHTYSSGFHSEYPWNLVGTGSDKPSGPPNKDKKKDMKDGAVRGNQQFSWTNIQLLISLFYLKMTTSIPCMLLHSGTDHGSRWSLRREQTLLNIKTSHTKIMSGAIYGLSIIKCNLQRGVCTDEVKVWKLVKPREC